MHITCDEFESGVCHSLIGAGATEQDARLAAAALTYAESSGLRSHGLLRVRPLLDQLHSAKINGRPERTVQQVAESTWLVDADYGLGFPAAQSGADAVIQSLEKSPVAIAAVSKSHQLGIAGYYAEQIALKGFVGFVTSSTFGAIAPTGGRTPIMGNPPLALALPTNGDPIVVDFAPAVVARGNIAAAARRGDKIPTSWALDENGQPTDDPQAAMRGTLNAIGGRKGVLLAILMDLLIIALTNSNLPRETSSVFTPSGDAPSLGHIILGFNPESFEITDAQQRCERYLNYVLADGKDMHVPGEGRRKSRLAAIEHGLDVDAQMWRDILL